MQKNIRFPVSLWERVEDVLGDRPKSEFIREAVEEKLRPLEVEKRLRALEGRDA